MRTRARTRHACATTLATRARATTHATHSQDLLSLFVARAVVDDILPPSAHGRWTQGEPRAQKKQLGRKEPRTQGRRSTARHAPPGAAGEPSAGARRTSQSHPRAEALVCVRTLKHGFPCVYRRRARRQPSGQPQGQNRGPPQRQVRARVFGWGDDVSVASCAAASAPPTSPAARHFSLVAWPDELGAAGSWKRVGRRRPSHAHARRRSTQTCAQHALDHGTGFASSSRARAPPRHTNTRTRRHSAERMLRCWGAGAGQSHAEVRGVPPPRTRPRAAPLAAARLQKPSGGAASARPRRPLSRRVLFSLTPSRCLQTRPAQTKERMSKVLEEYLDSHDAAEASRCLRQVGRRAAPCAHTRAHTYLRHTDAMHAQTKHR